MASDPSFIVPVPAHYLGDGMQAIDVVDAFSLNFRTGSAIKYILRCGKKGDEKDAIRDLEKAIHFLQSELAFRQGKRGKETMKIAK